MEEEIKRTNKLIQTVYCVFWLLPVCLVIAGETGDSWVGVYAEQARTTYLAETLVILLTASMVPLSLKLFSWILEKKINTAHFPHALRLYAVWSCIRLCMLAVPALSGLVAYYMMLSNKSVLCALISLTASLFCIPGIKRLRRELQLEDSAD